MATYMSKLTNLTVLTLCLLGASTSAAPLPNSDVAIINSNVQVADKRGYDGDWLYSREDVVKKVVVANGEIPDTERRGYDGDWLYSRDPVDLEPTN